MDYKNFVMLVVQNAEPAIYIIKASPFVLKQIKNKLQQAAYRLTEVEVLTDDTCMRPNMFGKNIVFAPYNKDWHDRLKTTQVGVPVILLATDKVAEALDIEDISPQAIAGAIMGRATKLGYTVTHKVVMDLLKIMEPDQVTVKLDELALKYPGEELNDDHVSSLIDETSGHVFDLFDAILKGMRPKVKSLLEKVTATESPTVIHATLITLTRRVVIARAHDKEQRSFKEFMVAAGLDKKEGAAKKAWIQAKQTPDHALNALAKALADAEIDIKFRYKKPEEALLERLLPAL